MTRQILLLAAFAAAPVLPFTTATPALAQPAEDAAAIAQAHQVCAKGLAWLKSQQQPDGLWTRSPREPIALSALVLRAMVQEPSIGPNDPAVKKGFAKLLSYQKDDGSIQTGMLANYNTAIIVSALAAAKDPAYQPAIDKAVAYLKSVQWSDSIALPGGKKIDTGHPFYGGWGYGATARDSRPDLSNTAIVVEALKDAGVPQSDPAFTRAAAFVSRLQNSSETNTLKWAGNDGGFVYSISADGKGGSSAGEYTDASGKQMVRSYGTMTYAGLKSMVYAGLSKDDPRVKAAWNWITSNWSLDENPGMRAGNPADAKAGLYYYYQTLARALSVYGQTSVDAAGHKFDWRRQLIARIADAQKPDGSFVGERKFMENNPVLATSFSVLALQDAVKDLQARP